VSGQGGGPAGAASARRLLARRRRAAAAGVGGRARGGGRDRRLERAVAAGDWAAICNDLFTRATRRRAGGADCGRLLRSDAAGTRRPRIDLVSIEPKRGGALARVRTRARGQPPLADTIELRREADGYRVEALGR
jgi:hypothetical protein